MTGCTCGITKPVSRRQVSLFGLAAAGLALVPTRSRASSVTALGFTCIDYRLVDDAVHFFDHLKLTNDYDQLALAGASLGAISPKFPSSNKAFWDHVEISKSLHHIKKIIIVDHRDCGAYKVAFGDAVAKDHDGETAQHKAVMLDLQAQLAKKDPSLEAEFYLMALDGTAERIV